VIRSKNIDINRPKLINIKHYDRFAKKEIIKSTKFYSYIQKANDKIYLIPTLTYYPRILEINKKEFINASITVNGSVLIAELKDPTIILTDNDINFYYTDEFREFYQIAFNYSTRTLNIDINTIKFFGVVRS
jgi:DNA (cytosine-5)-methyltransferase 1